MSFSEVSQALQILIWIFVGAVGLSVGSFLNVCIYRLPRELSVVRPPSHCGSCFYYLRWFDNIPILSCLLLRGRCRRCGDPFGWGHAFVELLTAVTALVIYYFFGFSPLGMVYFLFISALIVVSFVDLQFRIIPDEISLGGIVVGLFVSFLVPELHGTQSRWLGLGYAFLGAVVGGGVLYVTAVVGDFLFRKESMGGGDIKLLAMAGTILGWKWVLLTFFLAPFLAIIPGFYVLFFKRSHVVPYGPFLAIAMIVSLAFGQDILDYFGLQESFEALGLYYWPEK